MKKREGREKEGEGEGEREREKEREGRELSGCEACPLGTECFYLDGVSGEVEVL